MNRPYRSRLWLAFLTIVAGTGCGGAAPVVGGAGPMVAPGPQGNAPPAARVSSNPALPPLPSAHPADVHFMSGMIHHHAQALVMADLAMSNSTNNQIRTFSERVRVSQTDEIRLMQQWLRDMGEEAPEPSPTGMRMVMGGMEHDMLMPGMLTEAQMAQLEGARGTDFDRLFLTFMIQHHEGALVMVEQLFATHGGGVDDFIYKVASDAFADQGSEIDRMWRMLEALPPGP